MTEVPPTADEPSIEALQGLLREARWYVYHADVPHESAYDDQQALLQKIDEAAPELTPPKPHEICGKKVSHNTICLNDKGHEGECDDIPY